MATIKQIRLSKGFTQIQLAKRSGVTDAQIRKMETGKSVHRVHVEKVLQVLGAFEEEVDGLVIAVPLGANHSFVRGVVMPRNMDVVF